MPSEEEDQVQIEKQEDQATYKELKEKRQSRKASTEN